DSLLETFVLNMYIRCGSISTARVCFDRIPVKDVVAWTSMIEGYGIHGLGIEAVKPFNHMQENGITNENELKKKPGWSCIEMKGGIHGFVSADRSHNQVDKIYDLLGHLSRKIQIFGYVQIT
ncbi:PPR domain-containing protein, partial [Cephalotus follicularis]